MINAIELFSGNADITKAFKENGINCISVDYDESKHPDFCKDVYRLSTAFLMDFDFIWASPDCTTYSLASHGKHRKKGGIPVSDYAFRCDGENALFVKKLLYINKPFIIENPRGHLRNMFFMKGLHRATIYYSVYGAPYSKPTDLFSNVDITPYFDQSVKFTRVHLDYCASYENFLGRCKMPPLLIEDIIKAVRDICKEHK